VEPLLSVDQLWPLHRTIRNARARGVEFTYRVGHRHYRRSYEGSMYLCAPREQFLDHNCPGDADGQFGNAVADFPVR